jgi:hypothetical protein
VMIGVVSSGSNRWLTVFIKTNSERLSKKLCGKSPDVFTWKPRVKSPLRRVQVQVGPYDLHAHGLLLRLVLYGLLLRLVLHKINILTAPPVAQVPAAMRSYNR